VEKLYPAERLAGVSVILKTHELALAGPMFSRVDTDRERLGLYLPWVTLVKTVADEENYIRSTFLHWQDGRAFEYGIFLKDSLEYLGNIGVHTISWDDERCELGYWLSGAAEGKGYMVEAVGLLEAELFRLGFHRIEIRCNSRNARSAAVPKRCGYVLEGVLREDMMEQGARRDTMVWAKLARER
jgi:ribosomal-protein-serine acetyltransferase